MPRTTEELVGGLIELDDSVPVDPFITTASLLVDRLCAPEVDDDTELEIVERWLSAHFYAVRESRSVSESVAGISETKQSKVDLGLDLSHYGQTAKLLDSSGALARWDQAMRKGRSTTATLAWMGSTNYPDLPN
jgi:hypothetical protein